MTNIWREGEKILENKSYYNNIFVKIEDENKIFSIASILRLEDNILSKNYNFIFRFYKIKSFINDIPLEYIVKILNEKYPCDIVYIILRNYLKYDVSFKSIKQNDNSNNTLKITSSIRYLKDSESYKKIMNYPNLFIKEGKHIKFIISKIVCNLEKMIQKNDNIDINKIFSLKEKNILSFVYKINNDTNAWGITF